MKIKLPILRGFTHTLVFLQNAWSPMYAGGTWPRRSWLRALELSRSGQRLKLLIDDYDCVENTTPIVGPTAASVVPPDLDYVREILEARRPTVVIACGKQAEEALGQIWGGGLVVVPHPACRILTNELYAQARKLAGAVTFERVAYRQIKGKILIEHWPMIGKHELLANKFVPLTKEK